LKRRRLFPYRRLPRALRRSIGPAGDSNDPS
jgi:hypothetical protein